MKGKMKGFWILKGLKWGLMGAAFVALAGFAVMGLWNWLMPSIFGLGAITWIQALGLLILSKILFGGHGGMRGRGGWGGKHRHEHWREKMEARWEGMTDEQKAAMKERWGRGGCGHHRPWPQEQATEKEAS
jgi:hypothetical protein